LSKSNQLNYSLNFRYEDGKFRFIFFAKTKADFDFLNGRLYGTTSLAGYIPVISKELFEYIRDHPQNSAAKIRRGLTTIVNQKWEFKDRFVKRTGDVVGKGQVSPSGTLDVEQALPVDLLTYFPALERWNKVILEFGCGSGMITTWLANSGFNAIGLEPQPEFIAKARENAAGQDYRHPLLLSAHQAVSIDTLNKEIRKSAEEKRPFVSFIQIGYDGYIPLPDNSVDAVVLHRTLSVLLESKLKEKVMSEIFRVLKPVGLLSLLDFVKLDNTETNKQLVNPSLLNRYKVAKEILREIRQNSELATLFGVSIPNEVLMNQDIDIAPIFIQENISELEWNRLKEEGKLNIVKKYSYFDYIEKKAFTAEDFIEGVKEGIVRVKFVVEHLSERGIRRYIEGAGLEVVDTYKKKFLHTQGGSWSAAITVIARKKAREGNDPARPLPGQPMPTAEKIKEEVSKHDSSCFDIIRQDAPEVALAVAYLRTRGKEGKAMASYLKWLAKNDMVRGGPFEGFLATHDTLLNKDAPEGILLSTKYPEYNTLQQRVASLIWEVGATAKFNLSETENSQRTETFEDWQRYESTGPSAVELRFHNQQELFDKLQNVAKRIDESKGKVVLYLAGPSGAGKSEVVVPVLQDVLRKMGRRAVVLSGDMYFKPYQLRPLVSGRLVDHPDMLYIEQMVKDIKTLLAGKEVNLPQYNFATSTHIKHSGVKLQLGPNDILIIDSLFAFDERLLQATEENPAIKVVVDAPRRARFLLRAERELGWGDSLSNIICRWEGVVYGEKEFIYPSRTKADFIILFSRRIGKNIVKSLGISSSLHDEILRRARALKYITQDEINLIPDLGNYPKLPKIKPAIFNVKKYITTDVVAIILNNTALIDVVFGLKPAALVKLDITPEQLADLRYVLLVLKTMQSRSIKYFQIASTKQYCFYDEDQLRAVATPEEMAYAISQSGLEFLILKDIVSKQGKYYQLTQVKVPVALRSLAADIIDKVIVQRKTLDTTIKITIQEEYMPTYERPDALDRALANRTTNHQLFGHNIPIVLLDGSMTNKVSELPDGSKVNFHQENRKVIDKRRAKGHTIIQLTGDLWQEDRITAIDYLLAKYTYLKTRGQLDPDIAGEVTWTAAELLEALNNLEGVRIASEKALAKALKNTQAPLAEDEVKKVLIKLSKQGPVVSDDTIKQAARLINDSLQPISKIKITEIIGSAFAYNIAGTRTYNMFRAQHRRLSSVDDDSLAIDRIPVRPVLEQIFARRQKAVSKAYSKLYSALRDLGIPVNNRLDFEQFLANFSTSPSCFTAELTAKINELFNLYFKCSPDEPSGLISQAAEQIVDSDVEHRLRFDRILHHQLPRYLAVSEDTGTASYKDLPEIDELEAYDWIPVDYLQVFDETLGKDLTHPYVGRVFQRDLRGIAGSLADPQQFERLKHRKVLYATSHFGGDRDNSAEALTTEALDRFERDIQAGRPIDTRHFQQVVRKAIFVQTDGSVSLDIHPGNQFCFNTTSVDHTDFALPTTGAWLRIEEPFQRQLVEFVMRGMMAWTRTVGGHERCPGSRRPRIFMQWLWEEAAMVLYRELADILNVLIEELETETDPAVRIVRLGKEYLRRARSYTLPAEEKPYLRQARQKVAAAANRMYALSEYVTDPEDKGELLHFFEEFTKQFTLALYEFTVNSDGITATFTKKKPIWQRTWFPSRIKESFSWEELETGVVDLSNVDWQQNPVITLPDGTEIALISTARIPRDVPQAGSSFKAVAAVDEFEEEFFSKVEEFIVKQFIWDGQQLVVWPDMLEAGDIAEHLYRDATPFGKTGMLSKRLEDLRRITPQADLRLR
jgi:uridine kinase